MARCFALSTVLCLLTGPLSACDMEKALGQGHTPSFEQFESQTYRLITQEGDGLRILDGDLGAYNQQQLQEFYARYFPPSASAAQSKQANAQVIDLHDSAGETPPARNEISYCISEGFAELKESVAAALERAAKSWESVAGLRFIYLRDEDPRCNRSNEAVFFDVAPTRNPGAPLLALAFPPHWHRYYRRLLINTATAFEHAGALEGILRHQLGHILGLPHEYLRPEAQTIALQGCKESGTTTMSPHSYDPDSVMHYPFCPTEVQTLPLSEWDARWARALYGSPRAAEDSKERGAKERVFAQREFLSAGERRVFQMEIAPESELTLSLMKDGEVELYLYWNRASAEHAIALPALPSRPRATYEVPADVHVAYVAIVALRDATYSMRIDYRAPE